MERFSERERRTLSAMRTGHVRSARAGERCVSLALHGTAQPARARFG